jgi:hypothetical protein
MIHKMKTIVVIGAWLCLLLSSACSSSSTPTNTPTIDAAPYHTEAASTVWAQVTRDLALTPSVTPIPSPSPTRAPTSTTASTQAQTVTALPGTQEALASGTPGVVTNDLAEWVSQSVADGTVFEPGESFIITWTLKNVGTSTWTAAYLLRFYSGNAFGAPQEILLGQEVSPGGTIDIAIPMRAPNTVGEYRSDWVMSNELRSNFKEPVFLQIEVARPATPTPTATATQTATATPTITATPTATATP